jgi:hypothetical protein
MNAMGLGVPKVINLSRGCLRSGPGKVTLMLLNAMSAIRCNWDLLLPVGPDWFSHGFAGEGDMISCHRSMERSIDPHHQVSRCLVPTPKPGTSEGVWSGSELRVLPRQ